MSEFLLLALGLVSCWAIGALNKNVRLGLYLLAAMLTGFVGGAMYDHLTSHKIKKDAIVIVNDVVIGSKESTVLFSKSSKYDLEVPFSGVLSKTTWNDDTQQHFSTYQHMASLMTGLSPPVYDNTS